MLSEEYAADPAASRLLAEVVGYETNEIAQEAGGIALGAECRVDHPISLRWL